jgi:hypothetical protein
MLLKQIFRDRDRDIHIHAFMYTHIHECIPTHTHGYTRTYIHTVIRICKHTYKHTYQHTCKHAYTFLHAHIYIHMYMHIRAYILYIGLHQVTRESRDSVISLDTPDTTPTKPDTTPTKPTERGGEKRQVPTDIINAQKTQQPRQRKILEVCMTCMLSSCNC